MDRNYPPNVASRGEDRLHRPVQGRVTIAIAVIAFVVGVALTFWLVRSDSFGAGSLFRLREEAAPPPSAQPSLGSEPAPTSAPSPSDARDARAQALAAADRVQEVAAQQGGLDQRVAAMEQRLTRLDLQAQAAAGNAARAEGLLIAFATRRAIERGAPLGYLADQLRLRFGDAHPNSVQRVIQAADEKITLDKLLARLDGLAPSLASAPSNEDAMAWLGRELSELFVIRREDTPSPASDRRLERARQFLLTGRPEAAVAEIRHLPNAAAAASWIEDTQKYAATQHALELLETTAILEPRELRDGSGNRVEQPSPAGSSE